VLKGKIDQQSGVSMQISVIRTFEEMNSLQGEWNALVKHGASDVPFLRHEYLSTWWQTLGGGEWAEADLFILTGRLADGSLAGVAPLFFSRNRSGEPALMLLGCIEISDYLDLIVPASTFHVVDDHLPGGYRSAGVLDLPLHRLIPPCRFTKAAAPTAGLHLEPHTVLYPIPGIETYLASIDKKQHHKIHIKCRAENGGQRWYIIWEAGIVAG
jgi:hypothetical protein